MLFEKLEPILPQVERPARYIGGEVGSVVKDPATVDMRFAFCFPDTYDIGMSHLGLKILYSLINSRENFWCERVFAPWLDMEEKMREHEIPLYGLESLEPIQDFDVIGFTLQYELSFTNILNMLDLARVPLRTCERDENHPIVVAGGPCACNAEPLADFIDVLFIGDGEEVTLEWLDLLQQAKREGWSRKELLIASAQIEGVYVPSLYEVSYNEDGTVSAIIPKHGAPERVQKRFVRDLNDAFFPGELVVPFTQTVFDRVTVEVLRGCVRGCRFCQAGFLYRPFRERSRDTLTEQVKGLCEATGYEEVSLSSLSTSDYSELEPLLTDLTDYTDAENINLTLPSLRIDNFSEEVLDRLKTVRKSSLTFAPEAGSQRLRDAINKNITEEDILRSCQIAFEGGYTTVKLYFMLGLPTETDEDLIAIGTLAEKILDLFYNTSNRPKKGRGVQISISAATFVPKPFTPFEFEPQDTMEEVARKQKLLTDTIRSKKVNLSWHDVRVSFLEAVLARGDRRLCDVIYKAWESGCTFDSWSECFDMDKWLAAMEAYGLDPAFYANRIRAYDEIMPWSHLDYMVTREFMIRENRAAHAASTTPSCKESCSSCGVSRLEGGICVG